LAYPLADVARLSRRRIDIAKSVGVRARFEIGCQVQLIEQRLGLFQIEAKPSVNQP
jgi:hypothetical protein